VKPGFCCHNCSNGKKHGGRCLKKEKVVKVEEVVETPKEVTIVEEKPESVKVETIDPVVLGNT